MLPWLLCALCAALACALFLRLVLLHRSLDELGGQLAQRMETDTNNLLFLSTRDAHARRLAARLNEQLAELRRRRQRYENGDRALTEAVANASHDLRTPLTALCGYLELLGKTELTAQQAHCLAQCTERAGAMRQMTGELLRCALAAGHEALCLQPTDLNAAVEEAVASFYGALVEAGITPAVTLAQPPVVRTLDGAALARVLDNLLANALRYSGGDLVITLTAAGVLTFSNSAPGLGAVQAGRLFDRYYTVRSGRRATGLGLSIAKALTERMGGTIAARYEDGRLSVELNFQKQGEDADGGKQDECDAPA